MKMLLFTVGICGLILFVSFCGCTDNDDDLRAIGNNGTIYGKTPDNRTLTCLRNDAKRWSFEIEVENSDGLGGITLMIIDQETDEIVAQASESGDYATASVNADLDPNHTYILRITSDDGTVNYDAFYKETYYVPK